MMDWIKQVFASLRQKKGVSELKQRLERIRDTLDSFGSEDECTKQLEDAWAAIEKSGPLPDACSAFLRNVNTKRGANGVIQLQSALDHCLACL
jgi:hypothetical protein